MAEQIRLYTYWRSSAAYRVRIALHLKALQYETIPIHLLRDGGEQHSGWFQKLNQQQLVPVLQHGVQRLQQSVAILEYLDEVFPEPALLPATAHERAHIRNLMHLITCDVHPLNNLRVLQYFEHQWDVEKARRDDWVRTWIVRGFAAFEALLQEHPNTGGFCSTKIPSLADCCLIPQVYNARRFGITLSEYPSIVRIEEACLAHPAFIAALPENQPDAPEA